MAEPTPIDEAAERRVAWWLVGAVLLALTLVKPLGGIPFVGAVAFTLVAVMQLYLPLWRADRLGRDYDFVGLHFKAWRRDLRYVLILCGITFPPYFVLHYLYMTHMHAWALQLGLPELARYIPNSVLAPHLPKTAWAWVVGTGWLAQIIATHTLGVALPEETFYRGYLLPRLQSLWKPHRHIFGVDIGLAAVVTAALFAMGHYLGEWNPLRFGPFLPALVFAWQRNATKSVVGAISFHAACNVFGEILFTLYQPR